MWFYDFCFVVLSTDYDVATVGIYSLLQLILLSEPIAETFMKDIKNIKVQTFTDIIFLLILLLAICKSSKFFD